jgi:argininosuccinate lyase
MKDTNKLVQEYVTSIPFDQRLYRQDIEGSIAHARMLAKLRILKRLCLASPLLHADEF